MYKLLKYNIIVITFLFMFPKHHVAMIFSLNTALKKNMENLHLMLTHVIKSDLVYHTLST